MTKIPIVATLALLATAAAAQDPLTLAGPQVSALAVWDPDGVGPRTPQLVVGGYALRDDADDHIALYDPASGYWSGLGRGVDGAVRALAVLPGGELAVGGEFEEAGGVPAARVARWDGTRWRAFGASVDDGLFTWVRALAVGPGGSLFAGGSFGIAGDLLVANVAQWRDAEGNGGAWFDVGGGVEDSGFVDALAVLANGDLLAGGRFGAAGVNRASNIARWDGERWLALGTGVDGSVAVMLPGIDGELLVGGEFERAGYELASNIARWDGERWRPLGAGHESAVQCMARFGNGDLIVGGGTGGVARWDGSNWHEVGTLRHAVNALAVFGDDEIFAGGDGLHRWHGGGWEAIVEAGR